MPIEQVYLLKGWLLGQNPPAEITQAVESLIASLKRQPHLGNVKQVATVGITLPAFRVPNAPEVLDDHQEQPAEESTAPDATPKAKKRHNWSPEARAAQAERIKARNAAGLMNRKAQPAPGEAQAPSQGGA